jgi:hypothetical protein
MRGVKAVAAGRGRGRRGRRRQLVAGADRARSALPIEWDEGGNANVSTTIIAEFILKDSLDAEAPVARRTATSARRLAGAAKVLEAEYYAPRSSTTPRWSR